MCYPPDPTANTMCLDFKQAVLENPCNAAVQGQHPEHQDNFISFMSSTGLLVLNR